MPVMVIYYSVLQPGDRVDDPTGLARRAYYVERITEEVLRADMRWHPTGVIAAWKRGESTEDLVEIDEEDAHEIIERLRERWRAAGVLDERPGREVHDEAWEWGTPASRARGDH